MRLGRQQGFTLLEMLVALTIFALVSAMVYGGQRAVLTLREGTEHQAQLLKQLQGAMLMLERDITQHVARPVRDEFGDSQPALIAAEFGQQRLTLTRAGWQNPLGLPRSTLQRVAYGVEDEQLVRYSWPTLDRTQGGEPYKLVLLQGLRRLRLRFLDEQREWQEQWPPQQTDDAPPPMPLAVELVIELQGQGEFRRVIATVGN